ncbi:sigma-70 family RNA polymerase sigma factor [Deltaproteobacteria bacterium TL4]
MLMEQQWDEIATWVETYGDDLYRFAISRIKDQDLAEDMVQTTFLAAFYAKETFAGKSEIRIWLMGIMKHKIMDHFREHSRFETPEDFSLLEQSTQADFNDRGMWREGQKNWRLTPQEMLEHEELQQVLWQCIQALPAGL